MKTTIVSIALLALTLNSGCQSNEDMALKTDTGDPSNPGLQAISNACHYTPGSNQNTICIVLFEDPAHPDQIYFEVNRLIHQPDRSILYQQIDDFQLFTRQGFGPENDRVLNTGTVNNGYVYNVANVSDLYCELNELAALLPTGETSGSVRYVRTCASSTSP